MIVFCKVWEYFKGHSDIFVMIGLVYMTEVILRLSIGMSFMNLQSFAFDLSWIAVSAGIIALFKGKVRHVLELVIVLYFSIYSFAQSVHYVFFNNLFSYRKLSLAGELADVKGEIMAGLKPEQLLYIVPVLVMIVFIVIHKDARKYDIRIRILITLICAIIGLSLNIALVKWLEYDYRQSGNSWNKDHYLHEVMQNRYKFLDRFGIIEFNIKDIDMALSEPKKGLSEEEKAEVDDFVSRYSKRNSTTQSNLFEGKNLIMILCESFDESAIDEYLTPTLYKLMTEGLYFSEHYAPIYEVATGDSEFISQTGMLPSINNGTTSYTFNLNSYPYALANLFKDMGYEVNSYHSYTGNFYDRESMHESFGFSTFYDMDKLGLKRYEDYSETVNWILDEDLFAAVLDNTDTDKTFFDFVVTVSGHMPYDARRTELKEYYDIIREDSRYDDYSEEAVYYLAAQMSLDRGIAVLLQGLEQKGVLDDTVIYMFADHYPYGITSEKGKEEILGDTDTYEVYKAPMIIYNPNIEPVTYSTLTSTFDIYPTICDLFGLDDSKAYKVGHSVFDDSVERFVPFFDRSFITDCFFYDSRYDDIPDMCSDLYEEIAYKVNEIFYYSQEILLGDYYSDNDLS